LTVFLRSSLNRELKSPAKTLEKLYTEFNHSTLDEELYISLFYCIIDLDGKKMLYSNAGLNVTPVLFGKERFELLRMAGIPISNWLDKPEYKDGAVALQSGDKLFLYSDGILEMRNDTNEQYGESRLVDILLNSKSSPEQMLQEIRESAFRFAGIDTENELQDDVTMALLEIK